MTVPAFLEGFGLGAGLIIAIGAQNAYVLRQGLKGEQSSPWPGSASWSTWR